MEFIKSKFNEYQNKFKGQPTKTPIEAMVAIKEQLRVMEISENVLEKKIKQVQKQAYLKTKQKDKKGAIRLLKRKKMLEKQLELKSNQRLSLEQQSYALQDLSMSAETVKATKVAHTAMKDITKDIGGIEAVEELQDDMQDLQDDANDISEILTRTNDNDFDDDELFQELNQLELEEELPGDDDDFIGLPEVPNTPLKQPKLVPTEEHNDELAALEAEML